MRLAALEIRDFRSLFLDEHERPFRLELGPGMNTLVGRNNCGKSNVLRALALALDPAYRFEARDDLPGPRRFSHPVVRLTYALDRDIDADAELLAEADAYEQTVGAHTGATYAARNEIHVEVAYPPSDSRALRSETVLVRGASRSPRGDFAAAMHDALLASIRAAVRFVLVRSGETIESVLEGNFREILHSVIRERLAEDFQRAEQSRRDYISGLQGNLLEPLREQLKADLMGLFPEIDAISLTPEVSDIEETLSRVGVNLRDVVDTPLTGKGTGVRGGVLVAMLQYLARNATRGLVVALEEPEAFLHPAAQEDLRDHLDRLAAAPDVTLLVTTHSPFTVTRAAQGRVFLLGKDQDGRTRLIRGARGDEPHAPLIGDLVHEATFEELLARASQLPPHAKAVLLVEGEGDKEYLRLALGVAGRAELLADLHVQPTGGCSKMAVQAVVANAATDLPVAVLVDNDEPARQVAKLLKDKLGFQKGRIFSYADVLPPAKSEPFPYEAEDMFAPAVIEAFVSEHGPGIHEGSKKRPDESFHYDFSETAKALLGEHLAATLAPDDVTLWVTLVENIRSALKLSDPEPLVADHDEVHGTVPERGESQEVEEGGCVLVLAGRHDYARYLQDAAIVPTDGALPGPHVTHLAFYSDAAVQRHVPRILARYERLRFDEANVAALRASGREIDARTATIVEASIRDGDEYAGGTHDLVVLTPPDDPSTLVLEQEVRNTATNRKGRPLAWVIDTRETTYAALARHPKTTDELDGPA